MIAQHKEMVAELVRLQLTVQRGQRLMLLAATLFALNVIGFLAAAILQIMR